MPDKLPKIQLHSRGEGRPIVLCHALPVSRHLFEDVQPPPGHRLLLVDFPGFGGTPVPEQPLSFSALSLGLQNALETLKIEEPVVIGGVSMGGYWTMEFLRLFPERVRGALFIATRANAETEESRQKRLALADSLDLISAAGPKPAQAMLLSPTSVAENPTALKKFQEDVAQSDPKAIAQAHRAIAYRHDQSETLRALTVPALWMAGMEDPIIKVEDARGFAALNPKIEWVEFPKCGHLLPWEDPERFQASLDRFVQTLAAT
jgi:pimeloyl-ACP methyl ester carboxylesterase